MTENNTVGNIEALLKAAKENGIEVFISPHYYYPSDHGWKFEGALEALTHDIGMFDRKGPLSLEGFEGSGADWLELYRPYIEDGKTVVVSPHKVYGPESNDLALQLRKQGIDRVILAGMSANLCVEAHLRELLEQDFEVGVVKDATAAAKIPEGDGYENGSRWKSLREKGAMVQRLLWASTGTKNPLYPDTMYVDQLIGPYTVNTVPPATLKSFLDQGTVGETLIQGTDEAEKHMAELASLGINLETITRALLDDGIEAFAQPFEALMTSIAKKRDRLMAGKRKMVSLHGSVS